MPACEVFEDRRSTQATFTRLRIEFARWTAAFLHWKLGAVGIHAHPQSRQPAKERMDTAWQQAWLIGRAAGTTAKCEQCAYGQPCSQCVGVVKYQGPQLFKRNGRLHRPVDQEI